MSFGLSDMADRSERSTKKIKLLRCKNCDNYFRNSSALVTLRTSIRFTETGQFKISSEDGCYDEVVLTAAGLVCYDCEKEDVEIVELDECPHRWRTMYNSINRSCDLCGTFQKGTITYDK